MTSQPLTNFLMAGHMATVTNEITGPDIVPGGRKQPDPQASAKGARGDQPSGGRREVDSRQSGWQRLIATRDDRVATLLRLALGGVMFPHGAQKALGWFGGGGLEGTMGFFTQQLHVPALFAALAIAAEFLGSLGLVSGLLTRVAAFGVLCSMVVATIMVHWRVGFFMNWSGAQGGEGFEYHVLAGVLALAVMVRGGGAWSVDRALTRSS